MISKLLKINKKKTKLAIGLLSGTSVDGIDAVMVKIIGTGINTEIRVIDFETFLFPEKVKHAVLKNSSVDSARIDDICSLNILLGKFFADAAIKICVKNKLKPSQVDFIGSHGQTIHHLPNDDKNFLGFKLKSTLQIGDPSVIANLTGITTVGDFRVGDSAVGGDGAPLVPFLDYIMFAGSKLNRGLLNIGGIANITVLPKNCKKDDVAAFDTGPGNMLIDGAMRKLYNKPYDKDGEIASKGEVNTVLLAWLKRDRIYSHEPPKSTGREHYNTNFLNKMFKAAIGLPAKDILRTVTDFTAYTIWYNYNRFIKPKVKLNELLISGGGAKNPIMMKALNDYFKGVIIKEVKYSGIDIDNKEAVLFAVLANECLAGNSANMPSVTGAKKNVILGKICLA